MKKLLYRFGWIILSMCVLTASALAEPPAPTATIRQISDQLIAQLEQNRAQLQNTSVIYQIVERVLLPKVDVNRMAGLVVGRNDWLKSSPTQRQQFIEAFTTTVINTYSAALASYNGDRIQIFPVRGDYSQAHAVRVRSLIVRRNGQQIPISYLLSRQGNGWVIYDFSIENVSIIQSYRSQFAATLNQRGLAGLITELHAKNNKIAATS